MRIKIMEITVDYGKNGLKFIPNPNWNVEIITPKTQEVIPSPVKAIEKAINNPVGCPNLKSIINKQGGAKNICIVVSDVTRPVPSHFILEALLNQLNNVGVKDEKVTVLIATGLHRQSTREDHEVILGPSLFNRLKVIGHDSKDRESLKQIVTSNNSFLINKHYCESDLKIITGYVEPHFFFGFSGGRKSILPGIAGEYTIQNNHSADMIHSEYSRFGIYQKNMMHKQSLIAANAVGVDFAVNVCINEKHQIVKVAAGNFEKVHEELVNYQLENVFHPITDPYDIVICGNGGYPLDLNLYQAVKSMAIGEMAIKQG
jgi:nickel-dependent lactate racemase